jgi:hydrogenase 3 maturation protease
MKQVKKQIKLIFKKARPIFVGVGNVMRSDDGVGPYIASRVSNGFFIDAGETPENYIGSIAKHKPDIVVIIDALDFKAKPGEIIITLADKVKKTTFSTHGMSLELFTCQIRQLTNAEVLILGIQPSLLKLNEGLSKHVKAVADRLIRLLCEEIKNA